MGTYRGYEPAEGDSGGPSDGNTALTGWFLDNYESRGGASLGIYNPKRLGNGWSLHAEGRASDLGTDPYEHPSWGWDLANLLKDSSLELGIQCIIFNEHIWSGSYPDDGWRNHGGDPHDGHLHVELSEESARSLTKERIESVTGMRGGGPKPSVPSTGSGGGKTSWQERIIDNVELIDLSNAHNKSVRSGPMKELQGLLLAEGYGPNGLVARNGLPDGIGGPATRNYLGHYQEKNRTGHPSNPSNPDYMAGENTWAKLLGQ